MYMTIILKQNSEAIRNQIADAGIELCLCASFPDSVWLVYSITRLVHGVGYSFGDETQEEHLRRFEAEVENHNPVWCKDVDEFIQAIKDYQQEHPPYMCYECARCMPYAFANMVCTENNTSVACYDMACKNFKPKNNENN